MKQVIFVGGTPYSGSTFFHLILANDSMGFACGEVRALFHPEKPNHSMLVSSLKNEACQDLWKKVYENGEGSIYETIFDLRPDIEFIVDSSKHPFWIQYQNDRLYKQGIQFKNILIWKTPLEFAHSCRKRDLLRNWDIEWLKYHRTYFSLIKNWRALKYFNLTNETNSLETVCQHLGISNSNDKVKFWQKQSCHLGGNVSARFHLYPRHEAEAILSENLDENRMQLYRRIYYSANDDKQLEAMVAEVVRRSQKFEDVLSILNEYDVSNGEGPLIDMEQLQLSAINIWLRRLKYEFFYRLNRFRYQPEFGV